MELNLKYNASRVDEIEQARKLPIENCIGDTSIGMLLLFIQKGMIDDNGVHGVSKNVAMDVIDKYLEEKDKNDLVLEIMGALVNGGFLSRELDVETMKKAKTSKIAQAKKQLENEM